MTKTLANKHGFSLIELLIVIIIIGIMTALAMQSMTALVKDARTIKTEREMEMLSKAIVGDPSVMSSGTRADFGYFGDVGAFPVSLQNLYTNPGGFVTWAGPYIKPGFSEDITGFKTDEWGTAYTYAGGVTISSTGSGATITKTIADATTDYTLNKLNGTITDINNLPPGTIYWDSVRISVSIPDGAGNSITKNYRPDSLGNFTLDSLPAGKHALRVIYLPNVDTLFRYVTILPRHKSSHTYQFASAYFGAGSGGSGAIKYVTGTVNFNGGDCEEIGFSITNSSGSSITLTSMTLSWSAPTAWYDQIKFSGNKIWNQKTPSNGTGNIATFNNPQVVSPGQTIPVVINNFKDQNNGNGNNVNMTNVTFTILFSDGSTFNITTGTCL